MKWIVFLAVVLIAAGTLYLERERHRAAATSCDSNLREIDGAKQSWAVDNHKTTNDTPTWIDLLGNYMRQMPKCPQSGNYTINKVSEAPECSIPSHKLPK
jgi:hypothetical protein